MSLSANTNQRLLWTVRVVLVLVFGAAGSAKPGAAR
jgi:hypothetical protein